MATATRTRKPRNSAPAVKARKWDEVYTVTATDSDGNTICVSAEPMNWRNANCAADFMYSEFRPAGLVITDDFGYTVTD
jgi:hypothetical protein